MHFMDIRLLGTLRTFPSSVRQGRRIQGRDGLEVAFFMLKRPLVS